MKYTKRTCSHCYAIFFIVRYPPNPQIHRPSRDSYKFAYDLSLSFGILLDLIYLIEKAPRHSTKLKFAPDIYPYKC